MNYLAKNKKDVVILNDLRTFSVVEADVSLIVYDQLLKQLHLVTGDVIFSSENKGELWIEEFDELEEFDKLLMGQFDLTGVLSPNKLFSFYLLRAWLGLSFSYDVLQIKHGRKLQIIHPCRSFPLVTNLKSCFALDEFGLLLMKRIKKKDLLNTQANFFSLLNEKLEAKLFSAMVHFQSETGIKVNKNAFLAPLFDQDRNQMLRQFIELEINRL